MRAFTAPLFALLAATSVLSAALPESPSPAADPVARAPVCESELSCDPVLAHSLDNLPARAISSDSAPAPRSGEGIDKRLTNAERLSRGLPLKKPATRRDPALAPRASSCPPVTYRAILQLLNTDTSVLGYVSKNTNGAQYPYSASVDDALIVNFQFGDCTETSGTGINLIPENSDIGVGTYPYFGLIQGRDNVDSFLADGSYQYLYYGQVNETPVDSTPQSVGNSYTAATGLDRTSESAVWSIDTVTGTIFPQWTNPDGSKPSLDFFTQSSLLYTGGDEAAFFARYPAPVTSFSFNLILI